MVGVAVLDGHSNGLLKGDRALGVPTIEAVAAAEPLVPGDVRRAVMLIGERLAVEIPCAVVIVLGSGTVDRRQLVSVDEDHVVALAEPAILVLQDGLGYTYKMGARCGLQKDIVVLTVKDLKV